MRALPGLDLRAFLGLVLVAAVMLFAAGCPSPDPSSEQSRERTPSPDNNLPTFKEHANTAGLDFVHWNGSFAQYHVAEITCAGGGLFDYDGDGDLDVYLAQGGELAPVDGSASPAGSDRLYRNDLEAGGALAFTDVTEEAGLAVATGYGCGIATGDYDNDGRVDLMVYNLGANQLLANQGPDERGNVTFRDVTAEVAPGLLAERATTAAAFFDYDGDGWLDLFVGNYVTFVFDDPPRCHDQTGAPDYCGPTAFANEANHVFRNLGRDEDGRVRLADVTAEVGVGPPKDPTLGVVTDDFDGDGRTDVYVANDGEPNRLWMNRVAETGGFVDEALLAGAGVNAEGASEASMGVTAGDVDGDGDPDLFMTHLIRETNTLYLNDGRGFFEDRTLASGLGAASLSFTSFGTAFLDYDNDGWLDLLVVNGAVTKLPSIWGTGGSRTAETIPLGLPNQLFRNLGAAGSLRFVDVTAEAGPAFELSEVSRGAALGDLDNDGDTDVVIVNNDGPVRLLVNEAGHRRHWLGLSLVAGDPPRDQLGARAAVVRDGRPRTWRRVRVDGSYNVAQDPRVLFGLGEDPKVDSVRVVWPDGTVEEWDGVAVDRYTTLVKGSGRVR